jgi:hypothetical protein
LTFILQQNSKDVKRQIRKDVKLQSHDGKKVQEDFLSIIAKGICVFESVAIYCNQVKESKQKKTVHYCENPQYL